MKHLLSLCLLLCLACAASAQAPKKNAGQPRPKAAAKKPAATKTAAPPLSDDELKAKLDAAFKLAPAESVKELESLLKSNPRSALRPRALELLTAARAALGDELLKAGDARGGVEQFRRAVADAPDPVPDKLFQEVVSQLPANLFLRGQREAAFELARSIEARVKSDPKRLVALAGFYLSVEQPEEAARIASAASALAPDSAPAQLALAAAHRISLQLDKAADAYKRALELDPKSAVARRGLADLQRASGRAEDALALYRELLAADPKDQAARAGLVASLFDAGRKEEAERELESALRESPSNLPLLV
ncbi:MAG TPA: tetratricopeptide repeat protein, partial [Pyrinomonadaceae bacterium]|nr:tetratricopeptide repeat protein [Pyrinomonadaceae bacterium]